MRRIKKMDTWRTQIRLDCNQLLPPAPRGASEHNTAASTIESPLPACMQCGRWTIWEHKRTGPSFQVPLIKLAVGKLPRIPVSPIGAGRCWRWHHFPVDMAEPVNPWASAGVEYLNLKKAFTSWRIVFLLLLSYFLAVYVSTSRLWNVTLNNIIIHYLASNFITVTEASS